MYVKKKVSVKNGQVQLILIKSIIPGLFLLSYDSWILVKDVTLNV